MSDLLVTDGARKVNRSAAGEVEALRGPDLTVDEDASVAVMSLIAD